MKNLSRRNVCAALPMVAMARVAAGQVHASESPAPKAAQPPTRTVPAKDVPGAPVASGALAESRVFPFDAMPMRTMANGGESRDIVHGTLATGVTVNLHQSMQPAGVAANPLHAIQHTEFILVREGTLEFEREGAAPERVGPGGVILVALGTRHTVKNVGAGPARYFVVAIGGDAK